MSTSENKIEVFDPSALKKRVSDSVTATFGMMIPETQWAAMVEREVKAFFEEPTSPFSITEERVKDGSWGSEKIVSHHLTTKLTPFRALIWKQCSDMCIAQIQAALHGEGLKCIVKKAWEYPTSGGQGIEVIKEVELSDMLVRKLEDLAPKLVAKLFESMYAGAVLQAKNDVLQELSNKAR